MPRSTTALIATVALSCVPAPTAPSATREEATPAEVPQEGSFGAAAAGRLEGEEEARPPNVVAQLGGRAPGHRGSVYDACALGSHTLLSHGGDGVVRIWDAENGAGRGVIRAHGRDARLANLACAPHGRRFAVVDDGYTNHRGVSRTLHIRDATGAVETVVPIESEAVTLAFSPDGEQLAWLDDACRLNVVECRSGERRVSPGDAHAVDDGALAWSGDGKTVARACAALPGADFGVGLYEVATLSPLAQHDLATPFGQVVDVGFVKGQLVYSTDALHFLEPRSLSPVGRVAMPLRGRSTRFRISPSGDRMVTWGQGAVEIRDATGETVRAKLDVPADGVRWVTDDRLAVFFENGIRIFHGPALTEVATPVEPRGRIDAMDVSPDGSRLAVGDVAGQIIVFSLVDGRATRVFEASSQPVSAVVFAPNGDLMARLGYRGDRLVRLSADDFATTHDGAAPETRELFDAEGDVGVVSEEGRLMALTREGALREVALSKGRVAGVSPNGRHVAAIAEQQLRWMSLDRNRLALVAQAPLPSEMASQCTFSADGRRLACTSPTSLSGRIYDEAGALLHTIERNLSAEPHEVTPGGGLLETRKHERLCLLDVTGAERCSDVRRGTYVARSVSFEGQPVVAIAGDGGVVELVELPSR